MIEAIENGILTAGTIGMFWGIMLVEQNPRAGFCVAATCLLVMILVILVDMKIPRRSWHSKRGTSDTYRHHHTTRRR